MEIREVKLEDASAIQWLNQSSLGYDYPLDKTIFQLQKLMNLEHPLFVACDGGRVVGYIHGEIYENSYCDSMVNIMALCVDLEYQGKGVGRLLLNQIEAWAKAHDIFQIRLNSGIERENAHLFYQRCGYTHRKNQKNFFKAL